MASSATILLSNDTGVQLLNYILLTTNQAVTDAVPSFTAYVNNDNLFLATGPINPVVANGLSGVPMTYYAGSTSYWGTIPGTTPLTIYDWYYIVITFSNYSDRFADWFQCLPRTSSSG
jgi:hypothetical protein